MVAPWRVGSSWTRDQTSVPCIAMWILNHCTTREALCLTWNLHCFLYWLHNFAFLPVVNKGSSFSTFFLIHVILFVMIILFLMFMKDWCRSWNSNTLATSCEELTHWKRLWCWEGLAAGREGDNRGWDNWMASVTWWWTGRPGVLRFMGSQRVGHEWSTELNWTELNGYYVVSLRSFDLYSPDD